MFLDNQVLGVEVGWNVRDTDDCRKKKKRCRISIYKKEVLYKIFYYLHLALPGVVETLAVPSSK